MSSIPNKLRLCLTGGADIEEQFVVDDAFFSSLQQDEVVGGQVHVALSLREQGGAFVLRTHVEGTVSVACDRCLEAVSLPVSGDDEVKLKFSPAVAEPEEDDEGNIILPERSTHYDSTWRLFETIMLGLPLERVHAEGECNPQMMALLESHRAQQPTEEE